MLSFLFLGCIDRADHPAVGEDASPIIEPSATPFEPDPDPDEDGLTTRTEAAFGSDPFDADTDDDALNDHDEYVNGCDPRDIDTDDDALSDYGEVFLGCDPRDTDTDEDGLRDGEDDAACALGDSDGDGLMDFAEEEWGMDPDNADSDGDGVSDPDEFMGRTDPRLPDTDADGLRDGDEIDTDPLDPDSDHDSLPDGEAALYGTDPTEWDTDGDTISDRVELDALTDPLDPDSRPYAGIGDRLICDDAAVTEVASVLYDAAIGAGATPKEAAALYTDWSDDDHAGSECACTFSLFDGTPVPTHGVTVWIPARVHDGTDWESNPIPAAVTLQVPPGWTNTFVRYTDALELDDYTDGYGASAEHWFAFDDLRVNRDLEWNLVESEIVVTGEYTIRVSRTNIDGADIGDCGVLDDPMDGLHFVID